MAKVLLGMSGGMDSACAAKLLQAAGHEVIGALLVMHEYTDASGAQEAAEQLGISLRTLDCRSVFEREVIAPFCAEYARGKTPNPCILCNEQVKFASLLREADRLGCSYIATGHYASLTEGEGGRLCIGRALDEKKDQSYMLWRLPQESLRRVLFPLSDKVKSELRREARLGGLSAADKPESQEICFIPDGDYASWIEHRTGRSFPPGDIVDGTGKIIGRHHGLIRYTIGQRKGIGAYGKPMFVSAIDSEQNRLVLSPAGGEYSDTLTVDSLLFSGILPFSGTRRFSVKLRYRASPVAASVTLEDEVAKVRLDAPARAVTPGQSAVFYEGSRVAFGGFIR